MDDAAQARALMEAAVRLDLRTPSGPLAVAVPAVRRRMPGLCPYCAGTGNEPAPGFEETGEFEKCLRCDGTGDLDAARLLAAYECGRQDVWAHLGWVLQELRTMIGVGSTAIKRDQNASMSAVSLRSRVGG